MKIMVDTNVILSAVIKRGSVPDCALRYVCGHHEMVLCDYIVHECYEVIERRFSQLTKSLDELLA